jgi:TIGR03009 family protein
MRFCNLSSTVLFASISLLLCAAPPPAADSRRLDDLLRAWENQSKSTRDLQCEFQLTTIDGVLKTETVEYGKASGMKPYFGRLDLLDENGKFTRIFISTGKAIHQYEFKTKQEIVHVLPEPVGVVGGNNMPGPLGFVFGMTAADAKRRFNIALAKEYAKDGGEYAELDITPRTQADQQEFKRARMVLNKKTNLPKEILVTEPGGNQQHWVFTQLQTNVSPPISAKDLAPLSPPKDWKRTENRLGDQPAPAQPAKAKSTPPTKTRPEAMRPQQKR